MTPTFPRGILISVLILAAIASVVYVQKPRHSDILQGQLPPLSSSSVGSSQQLRSEGSNNIGGRRLHDKNNNRIQRETGWEEASEDDGQEQRDLALFVVIPELDDDLENSDSGLTDDNAMVIIEAAQNFTGEEDLPADLPPQNTTANEAFASATVSKPPAVPSTPMPTPRPTAWPSPRPSPRPTPRPSPRPTPRPTPRQTGNPTPIPSPRPTPRPSPTPSQKPSPRPSPRPTTAAPTSTDAPTWEPFGPIQFVGNEQNFYAPYPLGVCQGDCDSDDDCAEDLYCFQRTRYGAVPGCTGGEDFASTSDFCVWNTTWPRPDLPIVYEDFGDLQYVGNDGTFYAIYPLGPCQGDCDTDDDCAESLYCHQRNGGQNVPGCIGGDMDTTTGDFCAWNTSLPRPDPTPEMPADAFRLKLYWEEGYLWQNETFEREWCVFYNYDGYPGTGICWYGREQRNCSNSELYTGLCLDYDPRQWFTFVELGSTYSGNPDVPEVMIQTASEGSPRCLARHLSALYLSPNCNPADVQQRFFALRGSFDGIRFELGQYTGYTHENCVTNAHHPKSGEVIEFHVCEEARKLHDETSYWELF
ncbi:expressed unknown protein [Seminavis robusta]|uniref:Uncharacterized protein n=1 Tax=Seminavis robusta TaxID=568900 RepID=A0A9N8DCK4_9STRA|nr:expressed unknown protein [Seminavis robusta]|eukprot:Sro82_g043720.1 n/a (585) ;mRNA; r:19046-21405